jgi:hypothetical protein
MLGAFISSDQRNKKFVNALKMLRVMLSFIIYCTSTVKGKSLCDTLGAKQTGEERWGGGGDIYNPSGN